MKALFVITTKDIPLSGFSKVRQKLTSELDSFMENNILSDYDDSSVKCYLQKYHHNSLTKEVKEYLNDCDSIPIFKRFIGDYGIYVSLCLSEDEAGFADSTSHEYVGELVKIAQNDIENEFGTPPEKIFVIAHEADLTYAKEPPRFYGQEECECETLKSIPDGHIYIYWHEARCCVYNDFVKLLSEVDMCLEKACRDMIKFFGETE